MKRVLSALAFAALMCVGHAGTANAAGAGGVAVSAIEIPQPSRAQGAERPEIQLAQGWYEPRPRWDERRYSRDRERRHYRHYDRGRYYDRGPRYGIYIQPRMQRRYVEPRGYRLAGAHYRWCESRYRSYRASDNTFQPYHGPRRQCISPYI